MSRPLPAENGEVSRSGKIQKDGVQIFVRPANRLLVGTGSHWFGYESITPMQKGYWPSSYYPKLLTTADLPGKFYVEFFIRSEKTLEVHVDQLVITLPDGTRKKPVAYLSPLKKWSTANYALDLCRAHLQRDIPANNLQREIPVNIPITTEKSGEACFAAIYDLSPPLPSVPFSLEIGGVNTEEGPLRVPSIVFEQSKEVSLHP